VELDGLRKAHIRDGAAVVQYLAWLDNQVSVNLFLMWPISWTFKQVLFLCYCLWIWQFDLHLQFYLIVL
jgi:hypothetical protein